MPERYEGLVETGSDAYAERTERNARDAGATLVVAFGPRDSEEPRIGDAVAALLRKALAG